MANLDDYAWLTDADAAAAALAELADDPRSELQQLDELRKSIPIEQARLVVEQVALRRRAAAKFGALAARMFFAPVQLEQATDYAIAAYKAERFREAIAGRLVHDYCCGIGGDLLALAAGGPAIGWDSSPVASLLAEKNLQVTRRGMPFDDLTTVRCNDVAEHAPAADEAWHVDPDRRSDGRRSTTLEHHSPGPQAIARWRAAAADGAVKLAPACQPPEGWQREGELEWIGSGRECRQLVVWFGRLATAPGKRRATVMLPSSGNGRSTEPSAASFVGDVGVACAVAYAPLRFLYDPAPSVVAAHLLGALAVQRGLQSLGPGGVYLTGEHAIADPLLSCFEAEETALLRTAAIAQRLAARGVGRIEVKQRGVAIDPDQFRRALKLRGDAEAVVILTRIGQRRLAIIARRLQPTG